LAERGIEVPLVEQPSPSDPPARELAGPGKGLDPLDVEMEVRGGLVSAQESHKSLIILDKPLFASEVLPRITSSFLKSLTNGQ
jgi:hypothetical protein